MASNSKGLEEASSKLPKFKGRTIQVLERLTAFAASLFSCESAALLLKQEGVSRIVADHGLAIRFRSYEFGFERVPYNRDERVIVHDTSAKKKYQSLGRDFGFPEIGFFLRTPITLTKSYVLSLLIASSKPQAKPTKSQLKSLSEIESLILAEFQGVAHLLTDPSADVTVAATLKDMTARVESAVDPAAILDQELKIVAVNKAMSGLLNTKQEALIGRAHDDVGAPAASATTLLYRRALETKLSPPEFELVSSPQEGERRVFGVNISPFSPTETNRYFLLVSVREVTALELREGMLARKLARGKVAPPLEPSLAFLTETLVSRRAIRERKAVNYLTLRSWRQSIREYQIKAFKALKQNIPPEMPAVVANEIAAEVKGLVGVAAFKAIVPVPCGHSKSETCLSVEIARALGAAIDLPIIQALASKPAKGVSHPKENLKRPQLELARPITEPVLLVDDVATSGAHIEEAVKLLRPQCGAVMAVAWIGGDAA